jgi:uncharacterized protein (DUF2147 family)
MKYVFTLILGLQIAATPLSATVDSPDPADPDSIVGTWLTHEGNAHVQISKCGESYCGKITWTDTGRPEALGFMMLEGFTFDGEDEWKDGTIKSPADGKTRDATLELDEDGVLKVKVKAGLRGRTLEWTRVTDAGGGRLQQRQRP